MTSLVGHYCERGLSEPEVRNLIHAWNEESCDPPLEKEEVDHELDDMIERWHDDHRNQRNKASASQAKLLVRMALEHDEMFLDQFGEAHASPKEGGPVVALNSRDYLRRAAMLLWKEHDQTLRLDALKSALIVLEGMAAESPARELQVRTAWHKESLYYDLGNGSAVQIQKDQWDIVDRPPSVFRQYSHQKPQVAPAKGGDIWQLLKSVNLRHSADQLLLLVYFVVALLPDIARPVIVIAGGQGAAKTTLLRLVKWLLDPSRLRTLTPPANVPEWVQQASHHYAVCLDNLSTMPAWLSDALCRACTGEAFSKRALYTNDEDILYEFRRVVGLSGVNLVMDRPDLLDRSIIFTLDRVPDDERRDETTFWAEFEEALPGILGAMFEALSKAMTIRETSPRPSNMPRLADFYLWGLAVTEALGLPPEQFQAAFQANVDRQNEEAVAASPIALCIHDFMKDRENWSGFASELYSELSEIAEELRLDRDTRFPRGANWLWRRINEVRGNLAAEGIDVSKSQNSVGTRITLERQDHQGLGAKGCKGKSGSLTPMPNDTTATSPCMDSFTAVSSPSSDVVNGSSDSNGSKILVPESESSERDPLF